MNLSVGIENIPYSMGRTTEVFWMGCIASWGGTCKQYEVVLSVESTLLCSYMCVPDTTRLRFSTSYSTSIASLDTLLEQEEKYMEILVAKILKLKPDVLLIGSRPVVRHKNYY